MNKRGQATTEILLLLPLFIILAGGALSIGYMCWQGLKVQQAANLAARIQGQERVGGGPGVESIESDNGLTGVGDDPLPNDWENTLTQNRNAFQGRRNRAAPGGVYGTFYMAVKNLFTPGEQDKLFIPRPKTGLTTDEVKVIRILNPPKFGDLKLLPIKIEATAYGGEDSRMYGLPRWGTLKENPGTPYWQDPNVLRRGNE